MLAAYFAFAHENTAIAFEMYLKSGSGKAFLKRHLLPLSYSLGEINSRCRHA